ncbi:unnamed protein product [Pleuronectes platessa]|uniref:Uncharacterized protein n=1 Tax=Pleuronectes platessa TaxID=8262 RepID=A0A9N7YU98_PLEPL|nr:unnamed protein product [Pleuronectes platessa]
MAAAGPEAGATWQSTPGPINHRQYAWSSIIAPELEPKEPSAERGAKPYKDPLVDTVARQQAVFAPKL